MFIGSLRPASNRATWVGLYEISDAETGELIDLSDVDEITIEVRDQKNGSASLSGTKSGGQVTITDTGVFRWSFSESQMRALNPGTYEVGCTLEQDGETLQLIIGTLSVLNGIVS